MRLTCVIILAALVLAPAAWSQSAATQDELGAAIAKVKATLDSKQSGQKSFKSQLQRARTLLANNPDQSLPMVTALLDSDELTYKVNAAIILAEAAKRSESASPALIAALERCMTNPTSAVAYWGLQGLTEDSVPIDKQVEAIQASLDIKRSRLLRLAAARIAGDNNIRAAIPTLVAHLQTILPSYSAQVKTILTYEIEVDEDGEPLNPDAVDPGYTGRTRARDATETRGYIESPLKRNTGQQGGSGGMGGARGMTGGMPSSMGGGMGGGMSRGMSSRARSGPSTGGMSSMGGRPTTQRSGTTARRGSLGRMEDEDIRIEKRQLDPTKLGFSDVETLILDLQELPSVYELHEIGYITETLARKDSRDMPFGEEASFERTPPWGLGQCVEAAVAWLDQNRAEFPNAPAPIVAPATEEAAEPVTPAEETPET